MLLIAVCRRCGRNLRAKLGTVIIVIGLLGLAARSWINTMDIAKKIVTAVGLENYNDQLNIC